MAERLYMLKCRNWYFHGYSDRGGKPIFNPTVKKAIRGSRSYAQFHASALAKKLQYSIGLEMW